MAGGNIRAGGAFVEIFGKDLLDKTLKGALVRFQAFGRSVISIGAAMATVGAAGFTALSGAAKIFESVGSAALEGSQRTGMTTEAFSELAYAAKQAGVETASLEGGIKNMQKLLSEAAGGSKTATASLKDLGVQVKDLSGLTPDKQLELLADKIAAIEDPAKRTATAMKIFGRSGRDLLPLLKADIGGDRARARDLGLSIGQEDAAAADRLGDAWTDALLAIKAIAFKVGAAVAPAFQRMAEVIVSGAKTIREWIERNRALFDGLGKWIGAWASQVQADIGELFRWLSETTDAALKSMGGRFTEIFGIIRDLVLGGDITSAFGIMFAGIEEVFAEGKFALTEAWFGMLGTLVTATSNATSDIQSIWVKASRGLAGIAGRIRGYFDEAFDVEQFERNLVEEGHAKLKEIEADRQAFETKINAEIAKELAEAKEKLDKIKRNTDSALDTARRKLDEIKARELETPKELPTPDLGLEDLSARITTASEGTFLASAVSRLGGAKDIGKSQLEALERVNAKLDKLNQTIKDNPLAFT